MELVSPHGRDGGRVERRTWNTPVREKWNQVIYQSLKAIDNHNQLYFKTKNRWHLQKAAELRQYVRELKDWIREEESK
jgi:hypothetical protein